MLTHDTLPHGYGLLWQPELVWLHAISDALIAVAYATILLTLLYFIRKRRDLPFSWMFVCFAAFITACGMTHALAVYNIWVPTWWVTGGVKAVTAAASVPTAVLLGRVLPRALALSSPRQLTDANDALIEANEALAAQIAERERAEAALSDANQTLERARSELEERVAERTGAAAAAAEALAAQHDFLHAVIDANPNLIFVKDANGRFTLVNRAMAEAYHTTREQLLGRTEADLGLTAEDAQRLRANDDAVLRSGGPTLIDDLSMTDRATGERRWFQRLKYRLPSRAGQGDALVGVATDITIRKRLEADLSRTAHDLHTLVSASPLAVVSASADGSVQSWNEAAERIFGWPADEVLDRPPRVVPPELVTEHRELLGRVLHGQAFANYETRRRRRDGTAVEVSMSAAALTGPDGAARGLVVYYADIGERRKLEAQLRQSQKLEAIGQLAGGVAHDYRNVLTVVRMQAELLRATLEPKDPRHHALAEIDMAVDHADRFTSQLLAFGRRQMLEPRILDLNAVVRDTEGMIRRLVTATVDVRIEPGEDLAPTWADYTQVQQVLLNLATNARDAMDGQGRLVIETSNAVLDEHYAASRPEVAAGRYVLLAVSDTGRGMDRTTQARIFEPFFTTKEAGRGTGLGLSTVYGAVRQSGGHISVSSEPGKGTTMKVFLPARVPASLSEPAEPARSRGAVMPVPSRRGHATVLLAEDEPALRRALAQYLMKHGYAVLDAGNGHEALHRLAAYTGQIHAVITDVVMPEMSGVDLIRRVREMYPGIPALLMTGYTKEAAAADGLNIFGEAVMQKPFTLVDLLRRLGALLDAGERAAPTSGGVGS